MTYTGTVTEVLPANLFRVKIDDKEYMAMLSGKMRFNHIRVVMGDSVEVVLDPYEGKTTNRIIKRL